MTFAQSFHWMDQARVAEHVRDMLEPGGAWVHVKATTHQGAPGDDPLPAPRPPWEAIRRLVRPTSGRRRGRGRACCPSRAAARRT